MHLLLRSRCSDRLLENLIAIVGMHRRVAIAVENNGRNSRPVTWNASVIGPATLSHGDKRRGKVGRGSAGEAGMHTIAAYRSLYVAPITAAAAAPADSPPM